MIVKFKAKIKKLGNSYAVLVPKQYITNEILKPFSIKYNFEVNEDQVLEGD